MIPPLYAATPSSRAICLRNSGSTAAPASRHCRAVSSSARRALSVSAARTEPTRSAAQSMPCRAISSNTRSPEAPVRLSIRPPRSVPWRARSASGSSFRPGLTCPPLRPDAPQPGVCASSNRTVCPASARCSAADRPLNPPPITTVSHSTSSRSAGQSGAELAVAVHRLAESASRSFRIGAWIVMRCCLVSAPSDPPVRPARQHGPPGRSCLVRPVRGGRHMAGRTP